MAVELLAQVDFRGLGGKGGGVKVKGWGRGANAGAFCVMERTPPLPLRTWIKSKTRLEMPAVSTSTRLGSKRASVASKRSRPTLISRPSGNWCGSGCKREAASGTAGREGWRAHLVLLHKNGGVEGEVAFAVDVVGGVAQLLLHLAHGLKVRGPVKRVAGQEAQPG